jgi:glyoxylase-like metal-dependent hydrolase (beta-lactamase superfamily II)
MSSSRTADDFQVHAYSADAVGLLTNAFLVETPQGLVAVDALMRVSDARGLRALADRIGKPLLAVLITHGHPDHYNGVTELIRGLNVPVIATRGVDEVIHRIDDAKEKQWKPVFGDDWPKVRTFPNHFVRDGETLTFGGIPFTVREMGAGESHFDTYWLVGSASPVAFMGDMVFNGVHAFMNDGHSAQWLKNIDVLETALAGIRAVYTGHGTPQGTPKELLVAQRNYLLLYRKTVRELARGASSLSDEAKAELSRTMKAFLPTDNLDTFITAGANPVAAELARESA